MNFLSGRQQSKPAQIGAHPRVIFGQTKKFALAYSWPPQVCDNATSYSRYNSPDTKIFRFGHNHTGKLSCFLCGISTSLCFSIASARAKRRRVECGMITSSI